jgi:hypothetical protein
LEGNSVSLPDITSHGTRRLQQIWVLFVIPVLVVTVIVAIGAPPSSSANAGLFGAVAGIVAVVDFGSVFWMRATGAAAILTAESNAEIRDAYLRRMTLACAFAIVPTLLAFAFAIVVGTTTVFFVIAVVSLVLLVFAAPRSGDIAHLDSRMVDAGRPFRVSAALDA